MISLNDKTRLIVYLASFQLFSYLANFILNFIIPSNQNLLQDNTKLNIDV